MRYLAQPQVYAVAQNTEMPICLHLICVMLVKGQNPTAAYLSSSDMCDAGQGSKSYCVQSFSENLGFRFCLLWACMSMSLIFPSWMSLLDLFHTQAGSVQSRPMYPCWLANSTLYKTAIT